MNEKIQAITDKLQALDTSVSAAKGNLQQYSRFEDRRADLQLILDLANDLDTRLKVLEP